jgi:2-keto-3-deoxy-L-rhamnonate aldolase RhmA
MTRETFRRALLERRTCLGSWLQINSATAAEVMANAGFDWIAIDIEHTDIDITSLTALLRAMYGRPAAAVARVSSNDVLEIRRALDAGAAGVLVPFVGTEEQARRAVAAAKYPPAGVRGFSFSRANDWGVDFLPDAQSANDRTAVIVMIESREGVENVDAIAAVSGVDALFIGPYDLSGSYGIPGQIRSPVVLQACRAVVDAAARAGKSVGLLIANPTPDAVGQVVRDGYTLIALGLDTGFLDQGARAARATALEAVRRDGRGA